jgi:hypothetical protein
MNKIYEWGDIRNLLNWYWLNHGTPKKNKENQLRTTTHSLLVFCRFAAVLPPADQPLSPAAQVCTFFPQLFTS